MKRRQRANAQRVNDCGQVRAAEVVKRPEFGSARRSISMVGAALKRKHNFLLEIERSLDLHGQPPIGAEAIGQTRVEAIFRFRDLMATNGTSRVAYACKHLRPNGADPGSGTDQIGWERK